MRRLFVLLVCVLGSAPVDAELPRSVERVLAGHNISPEQLSIVVQATDAAEPLLSHFADVPRNPASVMKVISTWSALEILGPAYRWPTEVYFLGDFDGRRLDGDLALKGYGDPYLVAEEFWKLLRGVRHLGLEQIGGALRLDDSHFHVVEAPPGVFDRQPLRAYNVLPNALLLNFNAVQFRFLADSRSGTVRVATDPPLANLVMHNRIELADGPCRGYQAGISLDAIDPLSAAEFVFGGRFPLRCGSYALSRAVLRHDTYAYGLFQALWEELGGQFHGTLQHGAVPDDAIPVLTWQSPALADVIRSINKHSNNVMTRQLLYTLGAEQFDTPGTRAKGVQAVTRFLTARDLDIASLVIDNGAGLSRDERASAALLTGILRAAQRSPYAPEFISSLSLVGLDGTTRTRFDGRNAAGAMHVKTGRIDDVSALAGYVRTAEGDSYTVVILLNAPNAHRGPGVELQDAVLDWIRSGAGR